MSTQFPMVTIPNTEVRMFPSFNVDQEFRIFVALPDGYADTDEVYPVLYVLDADFYFGIVSETVRFLPKPSSPHKMIVVGIGYPVNSSFETLGFRTRDYTPTKVDDGWYKEIMKVAPDLPEYVGSGGAPNFFQFIREELVPFIHSNYRADRGDQTIFGHSFGGLFALFALFHEPDAFDRYIVGSPSIWWDESITFTYEADFAASNSDLPARVFMAGGSLEEAPDDPELLMVTNVQKMAAALQDRNYENLELTTHIFEDETHFSVIPATISRGLRVLFTQE